MTSLTILSLITMLEETGLMGAVVKGMTIVGIGTIGYAVINKAKEGDIWSAVTTGVLGALALAFVALPDFRKNLMNIVSRLVNAEFNTGGGS